MKFLRSYGILFGFALLGGCSSMHVSVGYDPQADFAAYSTYRWMPSPNDTIQGGDMVDNRLLEGRIKKAVNDELEKRGFGEVKNGTADFLVKYHAGLEDRLKITAVNHYYGYAYYPGYPGAIFWAPGFGSTTNIRAYEQGTLILDILDGASEQLVWRGIAQAEVIMSSNPDRRKKRIHQAAQELLSDFPPQMN